MQRQVDVRNSAAKEGVEVPDGINFGVQPPDFQERGRPGPKAKLRPLHGYGVPARRLPKGALALSRAKYAAPALSDQTSDKDAGGQYLRQVATCRVEARRTDGTPELVDLRGDVETHQQ